MSRSLRTRRHIVTTAQQAIREVENVERAIAEEMRRIENAAAARDAVMTPTEKARWLTLSNLQKTIVRKKAQLADAAVMALDAHPDVARMRDRFRAVNADLEEAKSKLERLAMTLDRIAKALEAVGEILALLPV